MPVLCNDAQAATNKILVYGDSLSAAYGIPRDSGWTTLLQKRLQSQQYSFDVINASVSGETTSGGASRMTQTLTLHQPTIVILELGGNDGLRGLPIDDMKRNLANMIKASQASGAQVLLVGMKIPPNLGAAYTQAFEQTYQGLAKEYKLALVPFFLDGIAGNPSLIQEDGIHPISSAQSKLLDNVWLQLKPLLDKPTNHQKQSSQKHP